MEVSCPSCRCRLKTPAGSHAQVLCCPHCRSAFRLPRAVAQGTIPAHRPTPGAGETVSQRQLATPPLPSPTPPPTIPPAPAVSGLVLPGFEVLEVLGEGGMGRVYKARHLRLDRLVAIKVIRPELLAAPEAVARFLREARATARLCHPNIVTIHDAGEAGGTHFLVMEFVAGTDLATLVRRRGVLSVCRACECVRQAALGLQHAHERGLVHRDIKPSNLLLGEDGTVKLLDLGLARLLPESQAGPDRTELTQAGALMGTPAFLAPEQGLDARAADIRSDIYSLGCTLYHLLTGRPPFTADSPADLLVKHRTAQPKPLAGYRADVPEGLQTVIDTMLARHPADRYQAPAEVAAALAPYAGAVQTTTAIPGPARPRGRRRRYAAAAGVGLVALGLAAVLWARPWQSGTPSQPEREQPSTASQASASADSSAHASPSADSSSHNVSLNVDDTGAVKTFREGNITLRVGGSKESALATANILVLAIPGQGYFNRGAVYLAHEEYDKAIADFTEAIRLQSGPARSTAYAFRSAAYARKGDKVRAEQDLARSRQGSEVRAKADRE